jgi:hypothetical protein
MDTSQVPTADCLKESIMETERVSKPQPLTFLKSMRSPRGFWGLIVLFALIPLGLLYERIFAEGSSTFAHWILTVGTVLIALAVFDFRRLPPWINWLGFLFLATEGAIFFLQGLADLLQNASLMNFAYKGLGQQPEALTISLFVLIWGGALLLRDSWGKTRIFGIAALTLFLAAEIVRLTLQLLGGAPIDIVRAATLLPLAWLLLEYMKPNPHGAGARTK